MMKTTFSVALFVLVVAGFYLLHGSFHLIFKSRSSLPSLDCVSEVRLPPTYAGALVDAHFTVRSNGDADLILEDFRSSCDCARLEVLQENRYRVVHRIGLKPGSFAVFRLRIAAASVGGKSQSVTVKFRTNMPSRSEVALDVVISYVTTKVFALPDEIEMAADVSIGKESRLIDVIGDHRETATITRAVVQGHGAFRAELLPPSRAAGKHATDEKTKLLGQVQVAATAGDQLGNRANLSIVLSDGRSLLVPLTRTVSRKLVFDPPCLALPRMVSGKARTDGTVTAVRRDGKPLVVEPVDLPSDFSFKSDPVARAMQEFTITWQAPPTFRGSRTVYISFRDKTDPSGSVTFPIVVHGHD